MFRTPKLRRAAAVPLEKPPTAVANVGGLFAAGHDQGALPGLQGTERNVKASKQRGAVDFRGPGPSGFQKRGR